MSFAIGLVLLLLAGGWLFVLVDGEDGRDADHRVADVADGRWRGVRTDATGRVLVVSLLAEPGYRADDQCSVDYRLRLREFADRVEVTVLERAECEVPAYRLVPRCRSRPPRAGEARGAARREAARR